MLVDSHQDFLGKYFKADDHYTKDEAPLGYLKHSKAVTKDEINDALNHEASRMREAAIQNPNVTPEHIDKALNDNYFVSNKAIMHQNVTKDQISYVLYNSKRSVRMSALKHKNATKEHFDTALRNEDSDFVEHVITMPNYKKYFPNGHQ